jgi:hypothetical protein
MKNSKSKGWLFWIAMLIVVGSHLYMLAYDLPQDQMMPHAVLNLLAAGFFAIAWYK